MIDHLTTLDLIALAAFFAIWAGYSVLFEGRFRPKNSINARMVEVREMWMVRLLERENRIMDAQLIGQSIRTAGFFASTSMIIIAALAGVLGSADMIHAATANISVLHPGGSQELFEFKAFVLLAIFVFAFFKFTWAIRQFSYFSGIVGSAPPSDGQPADRTIARRMALIRSHAVWQLNGGVRAYYFALAALGWFVHPGLFIVMTVVMTGVLIKRQMFSATARAIADHIDHLG